MWPFSTESTPGAAELLYMTDNLKLAKQLSQSTDPTIASAAGQALWVCNNVCESYCNATHKECWSTSEDLTKVSRELLRVLEVLTPGHTQNCSTTTTTTNAAPHSAAQALRERAVELLAARDRTAALTIPLSLLFLPHIASYTVSQEPCTSGMKRQTHVTFYNDADDSVWGLPAYAQSKAGGKKI